MSRKSYPPKIDGFKECRLCGKEKHVLKFYRHKRNPDGLTNICIKCDKERHSHPDYATQRNKRDKKRWYSDPQFRVNSLVSRGMRRALDGTKKGLHWEKIVPYTVEELMTHLEDQFDNNMSWDNYGKYWHIDHIIPVCCFDFTTPDCREFRQCWALSNLRPLKAEDNISKNGSCLTLDEVREQGLWGF